MIEATKKTNDLIERWIRAKKRVKDLKHEYNVADTEYRNVSAELGKWLIPEGQNDEPFNIWFGSGILQAVRSKIGEYTISWRIEPDGKDKHNI